MAFKGMARPIMAKYQESNGKAIYTDGACSGKAIKITIKPNYEDVSDYNEINDLDEDKVFVNADIVLNTSELPDTVEKNVFGHSISNGAIVSRDSDKAKYVGVGFRTKKTINGAVKVVSIWLHKVKFDEDLQTFDSQNDSVTYNTPTITGKAYPDISGEWRTKRIWNTVDEADSWLYEKAAIKEEG